MICICKSKQLIKHYASKSILKVLLLILEKIIWFSKE